MSQASDYGERRSEPWTYSRDTLPITVYSRLAMSKTGKNKTLRVRMRRKKNFIKIEDVQRMMDKIITAPEGELTSTWAIRVIALLKEATLKMLERMLPFLPSAQIETMYDFSTGMIDKLFGIEAVLPSIQALKARQLILYIAALAGLTVTIKAKE